MDLNIGDLEDYPDVDKSSCRLLGPTALIVQGLLGILVVLSLVYKRHREIPKRPWRIWLFDVSKQVIGQMFVHGVNILISGVVAEVSSGNACVFYFLNILVDTTLGVAIIYLVLHLITYFFTEKCSFKGFQSGQYGSPPSPIYWARQAAVYVFALGTMKVLVVCLFVLWPGIFKLGEWLLGFLGSSDSLQVIFTMGLFPIMMNILQFWLIDSIVKGNSESVALPSGSATHFENSDQEPLFHASSDDEDDGDGAVRQFDIENPRPHGRSSSKASVRDSLGVDDHKSAGAGSSASGYATPSPVGSEAGRAIAMHAYPPSLRSLTSSPVSSASSHGSISSNTKRPRRSPPPPLSLTPRSPMPAAVNATPLAQGSAPTLPSSNARKSIGGAEDEKDWGAWEGDDWADRVGEEDWTGKRIEGKKDAVQSVWLGQVPNGTVRIAS